MANRARMRSCVARMDRAMNAILASLTCGICQIATLALLAPFLTDLTWATEALLNGRAVPAPGGRWRQLWGGWRQFHRIPPIDWLAFCIVLLVLLVLPLATTTQGFGFLSEPFLCGILLIAASAPLWPCALSNAPTYDIQERLRFGFERVGRDLLLIVPLLALSGALIAVGLPGAGTLSGLLQQRQIQPAPALMGGLVFLACALLLLLAQRMLNTSWHDTVIASSVGRHRASLRYRQDLSTCAWALLLSDLIWPDSVAVAPAPWGFILGLWCLAAPIKLGLVMVACAIWRSLKPVPPERLAFVLAGGAILLVLAGRLS